MEEEQLSAWQKVSYLSALPDTSLSPEPMFNAPPGWPWPDATWQRDHAGWSPSGETVHALGYPLPLTGHEFWVPRARVRRMLRGHRFAQHARYGGLGALYCFVVVVGVTLLFSLLGYIFALFALVASVNFAFGPAVLCAIYVFISTWLADIFYVRLGRARPGISKRQLFWRLVTVVGVIDVLALGLVGIGLPLLLGYASLGALLFFVAPFLPVGIGILVVYMRRELGFSDLKNPEPNAPGNWGWH